MVKQQKPKRDSRSRRNAQTTCKHIGGGYQPIQEVKNNPDQIEMEEQLPEDRKMIREIRRESNYPR